jgi:hypothetical protein
MNAKVRAMQSSGDRVYSVIGLSGYAQAGKTTAANYIARQYGFERRHIAEPLRAMLAVLMRANGLSDNQITRYLEGDLKDGVVIPELGRTSRELQITLGTEWGRQHVGDDLWVNTWVRGIKMGDKVMNDSVRFPNEETAIDALGGFTIMIDRFGTGPAKFRGGPFVSRINKNLFKTFGIHAGVHPSERIDLLMPKYTIRNDGKLEDLFEAIDEVMWEEGIRRKPVARAVA